MRKSAAGIFSAVLALAGIVSGVSAEPVFNGPMTQGGLITGYLPGAREVSLDGKALDITPEGYFVFGFGRDAKSEHRLSWASESGQSGIKTLKVEPRDYKIDRIEGVEKKYVSPPPEVTARIQREAAAVKAVRNRSSDLQHFLDPVYRPAKGRISGVYGSQRYFNGVPKRPHFGLDIANKKGEAVYAPLGGRVVLAEPDLYYSGGTLILDHGFGVTSTYIHLSKLTVSVGDDVVLGSKIAEIGATGRVTGAHLDWRFNWFETRLDPALLMNETLANKVETK